MLVNELLGPALQPAPPDALAKVVAPSWAGCKALGRHRGVEPLCLAPQLRGVPVCVLMSITVAGA